MNVKKVKRDNTNYDSFNLSYPTAEINATKITADVLILIFCAVICLTLISDIITHHNEYYRWRFSFYNIIYTITRILATIAPSLVLFAIRNKKIKIISTIIICIYIIGVITINFKFL